jgi:hypothetical protein
MNFSSGTQCVEFIQHFVSKPPNLVFFYVPALNKCRFSVTKVIVRVASVANPMDWDVVFVYRKNQWHVVGGNRITAPMIRKIFSPSEVTAVLCKALLSRKGKARLEVDISFDSEDPKCDYVEWDTNTTLNVTRGTRMGNKSTVLYLGRNTTFPANMFECDSTTLKFIYDFSTQRRISIWDPKEIRFQERAQYQRRH